MYFDVGIESKTKTDYTYLRLLPGFKSDTLTHVSFVQIEDIMILM